MRQSSESSDFLHSCTEVCHRSRQWSLVDSQGICVFCEPGLEVVAQVPGMLHHM